MSDVPSHPSKSSLGTPNVVGFVTRSVVSVHTPPCVLFPQWRSERSTPPTPAIAGRPEARKPVRVLVVSAAPDGLSVRLESEGYEVGIARSTGEASRRLSSSGAPHPVVVADLEHLDGDTAAICRSLRSAGARVPLVFLGIRGDRERAAEILDAGADVYLARPFAFEELVARLRALLRRANPAGM